ncbi:cupin domain-containing protein [Corallococcus llansteffanensis]|uniref:Cupin domain-containing protein n=1 Tax=Corallococcus llansteffanensis TaxID=2316731 RepID=A0A3A8QWG6_9BACT|nr:cupin domain-containing protein [Corallococcus llansteffanensis]RKH69182.1 cupin domain-containing protein [Corallococcus llansteffanensis]
MNTVNVKSKFELFNDHWSPKIVGELNGQYVKLTKLKGEFIWHQHDHEDELFLVVKGTLRIMLEDRELVLQEGDLTIVPRGVRHKPIADEEAHVILFEPKSTLTTGAIQNEQTTAGEWI